jgi:hypothetical protein
LTRWIVKNFSKDLEARARWNADPYPSYRLGVLRAAQRAKHAGIREITVAEFGVTGGVGLLALERYAHETELALGVRIDVLGFDAGSGLPDPISDYRDHPDFWMRGDFKMDFNALEKRIDRSRTRLIIGGVNKTVPALLDAGDFSPVGFISFDLDLYSSTRDALEILRSPKRKMLRQTLLYFDDIDFLINHRWAGELLAIEEFNAETTDVKIDRWYNVRGEMPFPETPYYESMMIAHDLAAISTFVLDRPKRVL